MPVWGVHVRAVGIVDRDVSTQQQYLDFGLLPGEAPVETFWAGVVDVRRSVLRKLFRGVGRACLPGPLRNMMVKPDRTFMLTVTTTNVLVISGLTVEPLRLTPSDVDRVADTGVRRSMPTVVAGRLAGIELDAPRLDASQLLVPEAAVPYLCSLTSER